MAYLVGREKMQISVAGYGWDNGRGGEGRINRNVVDGGAKIAWRVAVGEGVGGERETAHGGYGERRGAQRVEARSRFMTKKQAYTSISGELARKFAQDLAQK